MDSAAQPPAFDLRAVRTVPVQLTGIGASLPERVLTNQELEHMVATTSEWIVTRTGIHERRIASPADALYALAVPACRQALEQAGLKPENLDLIIVATSTPDCPMPSTAALVQAELGAWNAAAFDLEAACSGFVYGLTVGAQFIKTGMYQAVLVIGADMLSRYMDYSDRGTCILFGDGAGALLLQAGIREGILSTRLGADGRGANQLDISPDPLGPKPPPGYARRAYMHMKGREVYKFAVEIVPRVIRDALEGAAIPIEKIDYFILHQANLRIIEAVAARLNVPLERMLHNIEKTGNTSAASIPLLMAEAINAGTIKPGDTLCLVGFGAGLTWGAAIIEWSGGPLG